MAAALSKELTAPSDFFEAAAMLSNAPTTFSWPRTWKSTAMMLDSSATGPLPFLALGFHAVRLAAIHDAIEVLDALDGAVACVRQRPADVPLLPRGVRVTDARDEQFEERAPWAAVRRPVTRPRLARRDHAVRPV